MRRKKDFGCLTVFLLACAGGYAAYENGSLRLDWLPPILGWGFLILIVVAFLFRKRPCQICGTSIKRTRYRGTFNGKRYSVICPACNKSLEAENRKEQIRKIKGKK